MSKKTLLIIGAGGHAKACIDVIQSCGGYDIIGCVDVPANQGKCTLGIDVIGSDKDIFELVAKYKNVFVAIGQIKDPQPRLKVIDVCRKAGAQFPSVIASTAWVSPHAKIGEGVIVMHGSIVQAAADVGSFCILNDRALIEHDACIGNNTHISTGAIINGGVQVGENSFIGSGAVVIQSVRIGSGCVIGANATIKKEVPDGEIIFEKG